MIGKNIRIANVQATVVGVLPAGFSGLENTPIDVVLPLSATGPQLEHNATLLSNSRAHWLGTIARLKRGVTIEEASLDAYRASSISETESPSASRLKMYLAEPFTVRKQRKARGALGGLVWLSAMACAVLVIAFINVTNLLQIRANEKAAEVALKIALGATPLRALAASFIEVGMLTCGGGILGTVLSFISRRSIREMLGSLRISVQNAATGHTIVFVSCLTLLLAIAVSLHPSRATLSISRSADFAGRHATTDRHNRATRRILLSGEVCAAIVVVLLSGLFLQSFNTASRINYGFATNQLMTATIGKTDRADRGLEGFSKLHLALQSIRRSPSVRGVALATETPLTSQSNMSVLAESDMGPYSGIVARFVAVDTAYFHVLQLSLLNGRHFDASDAFDALPVAIVSESFANKAWPGTPAENRCIKLEVDSVSCRRVVGVVSGTRDDPYVDQATPEVYLPISQYETRDELALLLRTRSPNAINFDQLDQIIRQSGAPYILASFQAVRSALEPFLAPRRFAATLMTALACIATVLAAIGLAGAMMYDVDSRAHELGIRAALGATPTHLRLMIMRDAMRIACSGSLVAIIIVVLVRKYIAAQLYGSGDLSASIVLAAVSTLIAVVLVSSIVSSWRISQIDPLASIRSE